MERREPSRTFYPDDTMMSDDLDGTSFPAVHTGPTGRMPDNPPGLPEHVTTRRPPRIHPDTPDPRDDRPLSWKEWLTAQAGFGRDHRQAAPAYMEDMYVPEDRYVHAEGPATVTISGGQAYYDAPPTGTAGFPTRTTPNTRCRCGS